MKLMHVAYSRPSELLICADETAVHGIEISIKMHPAQKEVFPIDMDPKLKEMLMDLDEYADEESKTAFTKDERMVGSYKAPCELLEIDDEDKI